jgi:hypothetical protein
MNTWGMRSWDNGSLQMPWELISMNSRRPNSALRPTDAKLGYAYHDVARALHGMGELQQARSYYEGKRYARESMAAHRFSFFEEQILSNDQSSVAGRSLLLQQRGDQDGADAMMRKADSIGVKTDVKD